VVQNGSTAPPTLCNSMNALSDIPIVEPITGNKRHTYYSSPNPVNSAATQLPLPVMPQPSTSQDSDKQPLLSTDPESDTSCDKGKVNAVYSETSMVSKDASYNEKVAIVTSETREDIPPPPLPESEPPQVSQNVDLMTVSGELVTSQTVTSHSKTVETTTFTTENGGESETLVEQRVILQSDGDPIDHDEALALAIQEATAMNPDMTVEKIEIQP